MRLEFVVCYAVLASFTLACGSNQDDPTTPQPPAYNYPLDDELRLHHAQVRGTHNSYHLQPETPVHETHYYSHAPLDVQLGTQHVRTFELDLHRVENSFSVYHLQLIDEETTCATFLECIEVIQGWSVTKPDHLPIFVWMELKSGMEDNAYESLLLIEDEIRSVFPSEQLLTPELVRGDYSHVKEALLNEGWPTLGQVRGRVMFILLSGGSHVEPYTHGYTSLQDRLIFPGAGRPDFDAPWAAVTKLGPVSGDIVPAVEAGMLIAANVCSPDESDEHCQSELSLSLENGIHMLKDDFPYPVESRDYWLELPEGPVANCHPLTAPPSCTSDALEWIEP